MAAGFDDQWWTCTACGKRAYPSRRKARQAIRRKHPGDSRLTAYHCLNVPEGESAWHIGHLKGGIVHGDLGRGYFGPRP